MHQVCRLRRLTTVLCLLALSAVSACGSGSNGTNNEIVCTTEARASVLLTVVDSHNLPLADVDVTYQVDGGTIQSHACDAGGSCAIAFEVSGVFSISVSKAGYTPAAGSVTVTRDVCHVKTESLTLMLRPAA